MKAPNVNVVKKAVRKFQKTEDVDAAYDGICRGIVPDDIIDDIRFKNHVRYYTITAGSGYNKIVNTYSYTAGSGYNKIANTYSYTAGSGYTKILDTHSYTAGSG